MALESLGTFDKLYHYSVQEFSELQTPRYRGTDKEKIRKAEARAKLLGLVGPYCDHISFFFDPIPLDLLGKLFGKDHKAWFSGNKLYEHVVTLDTIGNSPYEAVETPTQIKLMDELDWENATDHEAMTIDFFKKQNRAKRMNGEIGSTQKELQKVVNRFRGTTRDYYIASSKRDDFADAFHQYAANVPHLMVYPPEGKYVVESTRLVTIK